QRSSEAAPQTDERLRWGSLPCGPALSGLERRSDVEPELELLFLLEVIIEPSDAVAIVCEDQPERDVQHGHEESHFSPARRLERACLANLDRLEGSSLDGVQH